MPDIRMCVVVQQPHPFAFVALDDALMDLSRLDPQQAKVVELRFFGGLSIEETAEVLSISDSTVATSRAPRSSLMPLMA